jgi:hypothetical protein
MAEDLQSDLESTITDFDRTFEIAQENVEKAKSYFQLCDLLVRIVVSLAIVINFIWRTAQNRNCYSDSEQRLVALSLFLILTGVQNASFLFYPCNKNITIPMFVTFLLLFFVTTLKNKEAYILVIRSEKDFIYKISEFCFFFVFLPNIGSIIFGFIFAFVFMFIYVLMSSLSRVGLVRNPANNQRHNVIETNAQIFKKKYLKLLKGHFYVEKKTQATETMSAQEGTKHNSFIELESIYKVNSCEHELSKDHFVKKSKPGLTAKSINDSQKLGLSSREALCCICYLRFRESSYVITLPVCSHVFHFSCVMSWIDKNPSCPVCRNDLLAHYRGM